MAGPAGQTVSGLGRRESLVVGVWMESFVLIILMIGTHWIGGTCVT